MQLKPNVVMTLTNGRQRYRPYQACYNVQCKEVLLAARIQSETRADLQKSKWKLQKEVTELKKRLQMLEMSTL